MRQDEQYDDEQYDDPESLGFCDQQYPAPSQVPVPAPAPVQAPVPAPVPTQDLTEIADILGAIENNIDLIRQYIAKSSGFDRGETFFSQGLTAITVATPNQPPDPDTIANAATGATGYDKVRIHEIIQRNAPTVSVFNNGSSDLFVISSRDGKKFDGSETPILKGGLKLFYGVYELRIRSPVAGNLNPSVGIVPGGIYTVTEYKTESTYSNVNKPDFFILTVPVLNTAPGWNSITIIGDIINLPIALQAMETNTSVIYMAHSSGDLSVTTARKILSPGTVVHLNNTRGARYFFRGAAAGQGVEFLSETD